MSGASPGSRAPAVRRRTPPVALLLGPADPVLPVLLCHVPASGAVLYARPVYLLALPDAPARFRAVRPLPSPGFPRLAGARPTA